jgi:flagellar hook-length control protein FliK
MFDHARGGARAVGADALATATATAKDAASAASAKAGAADAGADTLAGASDAKPAPFAAMLQARTDAVPGRTDAVAGRADLLSAREPAPTTPLSAPVQQASLAMAAAINPAAAGSDRLAARVGTPAWDNQVGQKIIWMAAGQEQSATLTLNPPDLGPMQVVLSVTNDMAQVTFSSAQPEVRQALEQAMPRLREMMSESGLSLGNASVNDGAAEQRQAQQSDGQGRGQGGRGFQGGDGKGAAATVDVPVRRGRVLGGDGAVDTFA